MLSNAGNAGFKWVAKITVCIVTLAITSWGSSPARSETSLGQPQASSAVSNYADPGYAKNSVFIDAGGVEEAPAPTSIWAAGNKLNCTSLISGPCGPEGRARLSSALSGTLTPELCKNPSQIFCIERLSRISNGTSESLVFDHELNAEGYPPVEGDPALGIPDGGAMATVWSTKSSPNKVLLTASVGFMIANGRTYLGSLRLRISDIKVIRGANYRNWEPGTTTIALLDRAYRCVYTEVGSCGLSTYQDTSSSYEVKVRLPRALSGWLRAEVSSLSVTEEKSANFSTYTFTGKPVELQRVHEAFSSERCITNWCPQKQTYIHSMRNAGSALVGWGNNPQPYPAPPAGYDWLAGLSGLTLDVPTYMETYWGFEELATGYEKDPCFPKEAGLLGISASNAMFVPEAAPSLVSGNLEYKVAGLHFEADGHTPFVGAYGLSIQSTFSRCLFGLTSAPIGASIQVTSASGEQKVSIKTITEKGGWVQISASGFTFSSPTIRVKLVQKPSAGKASILCRSKVSKKTIKTMKTKCPSGYELVRR